MDALQDAAKRGVRIRILQSPGFGGARQESDDLHAKFPETVSLHPIQMGDWYGGSGIMHQKIWVFDGQHVYLGSANMDWKSIMQVKEMGVAAENCPELAAAVTRYFKGWVVFRSQTPESVPVFDEEVRIFRGSRVGRRWFLLPLGLHRR